ncbi:MAG: nickel pincer cofactor biosynthesis protein LarB [Acidobacteriota bacterium]
MDRQRARELLEKVRAGALGIDEAIAELAGLETFDLGFARIDHHRPLRRGMPEVVFGEGKSPEQVERIVAHLVEREGPVLVTRLAPAVGESLAAAHPAGRWDPVSRTFLVPARDGARERREGLLVVCAGTADLPVAEEAAVTAEAFGLVPDRLFDVGVAGVHRLLEQRDRLDRARVVIAVAGMEGALASVVTGLVSVPVIGVPTSVGYGVAEGGRAALAAMLASCAGGLTVVNIDNGFGAACAARAILDLADGRIP